MALSKIETASLDVGQIGGRRNIIINGDMKINQRQVGVTSITGGIDTMMVDRFACFAGTGAYNAEQSTDAPSGFSYSLKATCTSVGTDDAEVWFQYKPEAQDLVHLDYGSSDAKDFTISFWVKSTTTGQAGIYFYQGDGVRAYQGRYTINSSNTWEYKSVTIPGDPSGLFNNDNGVGLEIRWYLAGKTGDSNTNVWGTNTLNRSPSTWDVLSTVGNVFAITGVQMEVGDTATPFEHRSYGEELALCQRYYERFGQGWWARFESGSQLVVNGQFKVEKRTAPSIGLPVGGTIRLYEWGVGDRDASPSLTSTAMAVNGGHFKLNGFSSGSTGEIWGVGGTPSSHATHPFEANSEL